jgi:RNA polymerase sigma-70 factor (ECF subfamily)
MNECLENIDAAYWNRLRKGDAGALSWFYDKYVDVLFTVAMNATSNRDLAKDALQEVFIELWNYRETLAVVNQSQAYLIKVLRSILVKKLKKEKTIVHLLQDESVASPELNAEDIFITADLQKENRTKLRLAVSHLTERQQLILELHFYRGLSYQQIAEKLQMNYQSVNNLVFRAILRLRMQMHLLLVVAYLLS